MQLLRHPLLAVMAAYCYGRAIALFVMAGLDPAMTTGLTGGRGA
jgi:hypothetical protein